MHPPRPSHRAFGLTFSLFFVFLTGIIWVFVREVTTWTLVVAGCLAFIALVWPSILWPVNRLWSGIVVPRLGVLNNHLVLGIVYYVFLTPAGLIMRLFGRNLLSLGFEPSRESYFVPVTRQVDAETLKEVF